MHDRQPVLIGNEVTSSLPDDPAMPKMGRQEFVNMLTRLTYIERNAVDQSDFDALKASHDALEAKIKALEWQLFNPEVK